MSRFVGWHALIGTRFISLGYSFLSFFLLNCVMKEKSAGCQKKNAAYYYLYPSIQHV